MLKSTLKRPRTLSPSFHSMPTTDIGYPKLFMGGEESGNLAAAAGE
jgi:hypothetical protein